MNGRFMGHPMSVCGTRNDGQEPSCSALPWTDEPMHGLGTVGEAKRRQPSESAAPEKGAFQ